MTLTSSQRTASTRFLDIIPVLKSPVSLQTCFVRVSGTGFLIGGDIEQRAVVAPEKKQTRLEKMQYMIEAFFFQD
jgi:hypothetical protein